MRAALLSLLLATTCAAVAADADPALLEWNAMGTRVRLQVRGENATEAGEMMGRAAREALEAVEAETSAFRASSAVSRVSAAAGNGEWIETGEAFDAALGLALEVAGMSGGAFNPLVAPLMAANGFPRGDAAPSAAPVLLDLSAVERRPGACRLASPGMALDLGGVAKGVGTDRAAAAARTAATNDFLLDVGGTLLGRGDWTVALRDPRDPSPDASLSPFVLPDGIAAATSGNYERFVTRSDSTRVGHLFDPRTGRPAETGVLQVTVLAPSAASADAWSTALFVLGPSAAPSVLPPSLPLAARWLLSAPSNTLRLVRFPPAPSPSKTNSPIMPPLP